MKNEATEVGVSSQETVHLGYLDSLRGLAAVYVLLHHSSLQIASYGESSNIFVTALVYAIMNGVKYGHYAVVLFIVLSGFCLMLPVIRNNGEIKGGAINFFKKRVRRILPPYYLAMGLSLLLISTLIGSSTGTHWDVSIPVTTKDIITHLLLVQDVFADTALKINHTFWSISVEWRIYFLFPILILLWKRFGALTVTLSALVLSFTVYFALYTYFRFFPPSPINLNPYGICPHYVGLFTLGMLSAEISFSKQSNFVLLRQKLPWRILALSAIAIALVIYDKLINSGSVWVIADLIAGIGASCLLVFASSTRNRLFNDALAWKPLVFIGGFAYSLYLIHAPLLQIISQYLLTPLGLAPWIELLVLCFVGAPIVTGCSYLFFLLFERPFLSKKRIAS